MGINVSNLGILLFFRDGGELAPNLVAAVGIASALRHDDRSGVVLEGGRRDGRRNLAAHCECLKPCAVGKHIVGQLGY